MNLITLAKVPNLDPITKDACGYESRTTVGGDVVKVPTEARFPYFGQGFISVDQPRDSAYTADIVTSTEGWALADEQGNVLGEFKSAQDAHKARAGAKLNLNIEVPEAVKA